MKWGQIKIIWAPLYGKNIIIFNIETRVLYKPFVNEIKLDWSFLPVFLIKIKKCTVQNILN